MKALDLVSKPAEVSRELGGSFRLFGDYISGRQLELEGAGTKIVFDHTGFPAGEAEHLAAGWKSNYWDALAQYLK